MERKQLLAQTLKLWRERGDDQQVVQTLSSLSDTNRLMGHYEEGIQQAKGALEILEQLGDTREQARCLINLARLFRWDKQLDAAEAASRAIGLIPEKGQQLQACQSHHVLGDIYESKGEIGKAIYHLEVALEIASSLNVANQLFWVHFSWRRCFRGKAGSTTHGLMESAKPYAVDDAYLLARASQRQARYLDKQHMFKEAKSDALCALDAFEKFGAVNLAEETRRFLG